MANSENAPKADSNKITMLRIIGSRNDTDLSVEYFDPKQKEKINEHIEKLVSEGFEIERKEEEFTLDTVKDLDDFLNAISTKKD